MNILFFLTPKSEVAYVYNTDTIGEAIDKLLECRFTTVPVLNKQTGRYAGTLTTGDILRELHDHPGTTIEDAASRLLQSLVRRRDYDAVRADADIEDLFASAATQIFVPVVDDANTFIGIVTRREVMRYLTEHKQ